LQHYRVAIKLAILPKQGSVYEDRVISLKDSVSAMNVPKHMQLRATIKRDIEEFAATRMEPRTRNRIEDPIWRPMSYQDVSVFWNLRI
jgi:hypothetical protein